MAAAEWELEQVRALSKKLLAGDPFANRQYRVTVAASNEAEHRCLDQAAMLLRDEEMWEVMPNSDRTVHSRCLSFRMISHMICGVFDKLWHPHRQPHVRVFLLLIGQCADEMEDLVRNKPCLLRKWLASFLIKHLGCFLTPLFLA